MKEREQFMIKRMSFVTDTLQEFDNLDPGSIDIIFQHKQDEIVEAETDLRNERYEKRSIE